MTDDEKKKQEEAAAAEAALLAEIGATALVEAVAPGSALAGKPPPTGVYEVRVDPREVALGKSAVKTDKQTGKTTGGGPMFTLGGLTTPEGRRVGKTWITLKYDGQSEGARRFSEEIVSRVLEANGLPATTTTTALLAFLRSGNAKLYVAFTNAVEAGFANHYDELEVLDKATYQAVLKNPRVFRFRTPSKARVGGGGGNGGGNGGNGGNASDEDIPF